MDNETRKHLDDLLRKQDERMKQYVQKLIDDSRNSDTWQRFLKVKQQLEKERDAWRLSDKNKGL